MHPTAFIDHCDIRVRPLVQLLDGTSDLTGHRHSLSDQDGGVCHALFREGDVRRHEQQGRDACSPVLCHGLSP
ncbi:hypothetical protein D9M68_981800 [compost metagenome]